MGWGGGDDVNRLTAKLKFQVMAKQINNFKNHDVIEWNVIFFSKTWLKGYQALIFEFPAFMLLFLETYCTFQDAISPKAMELFPQKISQLFPSRQALSKFFICFAITCCEPCDAIFPPKTVKIEKQKTGFFGIRSSTILQRLTSNQ